MSAHLHDPSQPPPAPGIVSKGQDLPPQGIQDQGTPETQGKNAFNSERPLDVAPVPEGQPFLHPQAEVFTHPRGRRDRQSAQPARGTRQYG